MDRDEFEVLALENLDAVYRMAMQLCRHPDTASDLVQETYLKALRAAASFEERGRGIRPWLFKILHNAFYSRIAKEQRGPTAVDGLQMHASAARQPDAAPPAWDLASLDWEHVDDRLKTAIEELNVEYREVLLLWGVEGMKYREIAEILGVPIGTVMSRLHRARGILAAKLVDLAQETGVLPNEPDQEGTGE
ncbi:MAG: sigma-70 family RNA polymerase sigma factor [Planctomycetes bacterium]|nr:sigma-70 family RNA polymerase sigma factor [Planctomycetota bacterium]NOG54005.1 sigma-70 family RNA polymerase sigma factor [Planctomycetota bacterium]